MPTTRKWTSTPLSMVRAWKTKADYDKGTGYVTLIVPTWLLRLKNGGRLGQYIFKRLGQHPHAWEELGPWSRENPVVPSGTGSVQLRRDGKVVKTFMTVNGALKHLHDTHSYSWDHALRHEGYSITDRSGSKLIGSYSAQAGGVRRTNPRRFARRGGGSCGGFGASE